MIKTTKILKSNEELLMSGNKKEIISWSLYDFANSSFTTLIVTFIYATFFTKVIALDEISGTALWSRAIAITAFTVAIISPFLGAFADQGGYRKQFLFFFTAVSVFSAAMLYFPVKGEMFYALSWFVVGNIAFEMGGVFYNAFLPEITSEKNIGRVSGYGWGLGYIGGLIAMFIAMIGLVSPETPWFGISKEMGQNIRATNLLVACWFCLFSIPLFLFVKDKSKTTKIKLSESVKGTFSQLKSTFIELKKYRQATKFLIARLIYNDGLATIFAFGGIYAAGTFNFTFQEIMIFGIVLNIAAGLGALAMGFLDDFLGGKKTIIVSLLGLTIAAAIAVLTANKSLFWFAGILVGIFAGPNQSASRSLLGRFTPPSKQNEFYGFFALSGKFTVFLGPLLFGILTTTFESQRFGMAVVIAFFIVGGILLFQVDEKEGARVATNSK